MGFWVQGGVLTPAAGLGEALIDRFCKAGISFEIVGPSDKKKAGHDIRVKTA